MNLFCENQFVQFAGAAVPFAILLLTSEEDKALAAEISEQYGPMMIYEASRYYGGDEYAVHEVIGIAFLNVCSYLDKFKNLNREKYQVYLIAMIRNICRRQLSVQKRRNSPIDISYDPNEMDSIADENDPYRTIFQKAAAKTLAELLASMEEREKMVLQMRYYDNMTYAEIAEALHVPENRVGTLLKRAKEKLRKLVEERADELL